MADLIKKIRTDKGDLQIDYNALANKPSHVNKSGDTMTGSLIIKDAEKSSAIGLQAPNNSSGKQAYARVYKNASATADYGLQLRDYAHGDNDAGNSSMLTICSNQSTLASKIQFTNEVDGVATNYKLYGEHNKPDGLKTARTFRTNLGSTSTASFDGTANVTPGVTGTLPIANGGTGATTVAGIRENLGNLGKVYRQNPTDKSIAAGETPVTLAELTLPAGNYIVTGNHVWLQHTAGSIYDASIRHSDPDKSIYCYCRNLMDNGGGMACSAIVQLTEETTIVYQTRHNHSANATAHDVHFYAIKIT